MNVKEAKYLAAYTLPILTVLGVYYGSWLSYATLIEAFVLIPLLEFLVKPSSNNLNKDNN